MGHVPCNVTVSDDKFNTLNHLIWWSVISFRCYASHGTTTFVGCIYIYIALDIIFVRRATRMAYIWLPNKFGRDSLGMQLHCKQSTKTVLPATALPWLNESVSERMNEWIAGWWGWCGVVWWVVGRNWNRNRRRRSNLKPIHCSGLVGGCHEICKSRYSYQQPLWWNL